MRLAYVCVDPGVPVFGTKGASVHVQEIVRCWRARGAEVTIYCTAAGSFVPADLADVPVVHIPVAAKGEAGREADQQRAGRELAERVIRDGADAVYERYSLFSEVLATATAALDIPGFLEVNSPLIDEQRTYRTLVDGDAARDALGAQVQAAARIICVSEPVAEWVRGTARRETAPRGTAPRETGQGSPDGDRVVVVPNGVNVQRIRPRSLNADTPGSKQPPVVVFTGTLKPWHGVDVLIEAAARATTDWTLKIIGHGPQAKELRRLAAECGADVHFTGAAEPEQIPALLADCDIAVAPYPAAAADGQYFSPLKIFEYAAAGLPVVAGRVGQVPLIVDDAVTGLLVEPSDPDALAAAIDELAVLPLCRAAMSAAARRRAVAEFSWDRAMDAILAGIALPIPLAGTPLAGTPLIGAPA